MLIGYARVSKADGSQSLDLQRDALQVEGVAAKSTVVMGEVSWRTGRKVWHVKVQTARCVRQRISAVLEWAIAMNLRSDNPCDRLGPVLGKQHEVVRHMRALPHRDVASAVATVRASDAAEAVKLALEFLVLTAARWGEVRWARWAEMDTTAHVWTITAARMKANREHRVPLCRRAVEVLDAARTLSDGDRPLVFTIGGGEPLEEKVLNPGITRGAISVWLLLPGSAIGPVRTAVSDATALRPP